MPINGFTILRLTFEIGRLSTLLKSLMPIETVAELTSIGITFALPRPMMALAAKPGFPSMSFNESGFAP